MAQQVTGFPELSYPGGNEDRDGLWVEALKKFNTENKNAFAFGREDTSERREFTNQLFKITESLLKTENPSENAEDCLSALVVMSRDSVSMSGRFATKTAWETLSVFAGLKQLHGKTFSFEIKLMIYACKCLSNVIFLTKDSNGFCDDREMLGFLATRLRISDSSTQGENDLELEFLSLRLLFLISVFNIQARVKIVDDFEGRSLLIDKLIEKLKLCKNADRKTACIRAIISPGQARSCSEILKTIFNINIKAHNEENQVREEKIVTEFENLTAACRKCLLTQVENDQISTEKLHSDAQNALYSVPSSCFYENYLIPLAEEQQKQSSDIYSYQGSDIALSVELRDVSPVLTILQSVENKIRKEKLTTENLQPILSLLSHLSRSSRCIRKYCKNYVLPPRKDFEHPPEEGPEFRNKLIKLFTNTNTEVKGAAADFIFVLCKEKVDRLVKYTGYGNAAGLLASRGLLAGGHGETIYSDTDSDSDTEEYRENIEKINPVTGHIQPDIPNPMEGMSDEQKEYLAMQLANQLSKLADDDVIKPVCVDPSTGNLVSFQQRVHETVLPEKKSSDDESD